MDTIGLLHFLMLDILIEPNGKLTKGAKSRRRLHDAGASQGKHPPSPLLQKKGVLAFNGAMDVPDDG